MWGATHGHRPPNRGHLLKTPGAPNQHRHLRDRKSGRTASGASHKTRSISPSLANPLFANSGSANVHPPAKCDAPFWSFEGLGSLCCPHCQEVQSYIFCQRISLNLAPTISSPPTHTLNDFCCLRLVFALFCHIIHTFLVYS